MRRAHKTSGKKTARKIAGANAAKTALNTALRLLSMREHGTAEMKTKLTAPGRNFSATEVEAAMEKLKAAGYLDDERFAAALASSRSRNKHWGPAKIRAELSAKGIDRETAQRAITRLFAGATEQDAVTSAFAVWLRKNSLTPPLEGKNLLRALRHLASRGHSTRLAMHAVRGRVGDTED